MKDGSEPTKSDGTDDFIAAMQSSPALDDEEDPIPKPIVFVLPIAALTGAAPACLVAVEEEGILECGALFCALELKVRLYVAASRMISKSSSSLSVSLLEPVSSCGVIDAEDDP